MEFCAKIVNELRATQFKSKLAVSHKKCMYFCTGIVTVTDFGFRKN